MQDLFGCNQNGIKSALILKTEFQLQLVELADRVLSRVKHDVLRNQDRNME